MIAKDKSPPPLGAKDIDGVFVAWTAKVPWKQTRLHMRSWTTIEPPNNTKHMTSS